MGFVHQKTLIPKQPENIMLCIRWAELPRHKKNIRPSTSRVCPLLQFSHGGWGFREVAGRVDEKRWRSVEVGTPLVRLNEEILKTRWDIIQPYKYWDIYHINWCRISSINSMQYEKSENEPSLNATGRNPVGRHFEVCGWSRARNHDVYNVFFQRKRCCVVDLNLLNISIFCQRFMVFRHVSTTNTPQEIGAMKLFFFPEENNSRHFFFIQRHFGFLGTLSDLEKPRTSQLMRFGTWLWFHLFIPGTLNNRIFMDVWWNNQILCKDLESSNKQWLLSYGWKKSGDFSYSVEVGSLSHYLLEFF